MSILFHYFSFFLYLYAFLLFHVYKLDNMAWLFNNKEFKKAPKGAIGFVYKITNTKNNKIYIGKKNFFSRRKIKLGKKALAALTDKRKSKYKIVIKEMDWINYTGSNKDLNADIELGDIIIKEILAISYSKQYLTYLETKFQFSYNVLEIDSYNGNILGKFYRKIIPK